MLKYFFSTLLLFILLIPAHSQEKRIRGLRLGYDASGLVYYYPGSDREQRREMGFSLDMEVPKDIYPTLEFGRSRVHLTDTLYEYSAEGYYFRVGADRNFMKKYKANQYEMLFGGIRYGYSTYTHSASNIIIEDPFWGDFTGGEIPPTRYNAHWLEITAGIRGEIFKNFFIGWSFRGRFLLSNPANEAMAPYLIPGFGVYNNKRTALGMTYSIYYRIPLYKVDFGE